MGIVAPARWFRVDRIQAVKLLDQHFEIDPMFDREAYFASAFQHEVGGIPQEMVIWFDTVTAPYIRERRWHSTQGIGEHADGLLTLRFVVRGLNEVKRRVLFYGQGARVLGPSKLVEATGKHLKAHFLLGCCRLTTYDEVWQVSSRFTQSAQP